MKRPIKGRIWYCRYQMTISLVFKIKYPCKCYLTQSEISNVSFYINYCLICNLLYMILKNTETLVIKLMFDDLITC
jgi:hypothetical protein